jgi:hypothetical protein
MLDGRRKEDQMRAAPRRPNVRRIVIAAILFIALVEPVVMYRSLVRERERRQQAFAQTEQSMPDDVSPDSAGR